jgi:hypothetical protein
MNLFACEENVFKWSQTDPESAEGIRPLADWAKLFSVDLFRRRLDADYLEKMAEYRKQMVGTMLDLGMTGPWFMPPRD